MNRDLVARILREELMVMKMNQKMLKEHKRLVSERKDWYSLVAEEYIRLEKGPDFDTSLIEEGVWDSIKNFMAQAGSLEKGGKIFGRTKRTAAAKDKLEAAIQKAVDTGMKDYITKFEEANPGFPNQKGQTVFVNSLFDIAAVYDTLEQGVQDGSIDPVSANAVVEALREFVLYNLDYELADIYKHFRENKEAEGEPLDEIAGVTPAAAPPRTGRMQRRASNLEAGQPVGPAPQDRDTFTKRGAQGDEVDSATIKGLKSNVLPLLLAGLGALGTGFGWLAQQPWFIDSLTPQTYETVWKPIIKGQKMGITQQLAALNGTPGANLSNMSLKDFVSSMQGHGLVDASGNPTQNLLNMASDAGNNGFANWWSSNGLSDLAANGNQTLQNLIPASGAGAPGAGGDILTRKVVGMIAKKVATNAVGGAGAAAAGTAVAAGTLLTTLGLGTIAAGAAVKLVRMKGMKSSRAQLLKDLSIELQPFDVPENLTAIDPPVDVIPGFTPPEPEVATMPGEDEEGGDEEGRDEEGGEGEGDEGGEGEEEGGEETEVSNDPIPLFDKNDTAYLKARIYQSLQSQGIERDGPLNGVIDNIIKDLANQLQNNKLTVKEAMAFGDSYLEEEHVLQEKNFLTTYTDAYKLLRDEYGISQDTVDRIFRTMDRTQAMSSLDTDDESRKDKSLELTKRLLKKLKVKGPEDSAKLKKKLGKIFSERGGLERVFSEMGVGKTKTGGYVTSQEGRIDVGRAIGGKLKTYLSAPRFDRLSAQEKQKIIKTVIMMSKKFLNKEFAKRNIEDIKINETLQRWQKIAGIIKG